MRHDIDLDRQRLRQTQHQQAGVLAKWLAANGSLTARLEALSGNRLLVMPTFEGRITLDLADKRALNLPSRPQSAWLREATLLGQVGDDGTAQAWVAARSVFPFASLTKDARKLTRLGGTPIGYVMFGRGGAVLAERWLTRTAQGWQRSSVYDWQGRRVLISETFLPAFVDFLQHPSGLSNKHPPSPNLV